MKKTLGICFLILLCFGLKAQSLDELKAQKAEKAAAAADLEGQAKAIRGEIAGIQKEIDFLSGWRTGFSGIVGFDFNKSVGWVANPNPDASSTSLNIGLTAYALNDKPKYFWHNKAVITKSWQDVDLTEEDTGDNLFDSGTVDIFNLSSLAGYKFSPKFAASALGEVNTSVENFLAPGTMDIGAGVTWLPMENMTVVVHPLNYHIAFPSDSLKNGGIETSGALGAKVRVDYTNKFIIVGKNLAWSSTFTTFFPYQDEKTTFTRADGTTYEAGLSEYTWLNTLSFEVWKGIGVGIGFGLRGADFESEDLQSYYSVGLSYGF